MAGPDGSDAICWSQFAGVARWTWSHNSGKPTGNSWPPSSNAATSLTKESFIPAREYTTVVLTTYGYGRLVMAGRSANAM